MKNKPITVTQPCMPPIDEFVPYLEQIWENKWLTNNGTMHQQLEDELARYLGVKYISLFSNGTLALINALQVLRIQGEVITTPYSFVATTHSLWWNGIKPVFADVDPQTGNIDADKIEVLITPKTTAIFPVHVYGTPCDNDKIQRIADVYGLKVIYDAAHAFGVKKDNTTILNWGELSVLSFHATKVFNTFEGGAIVCHDLATKQRIDDLKNFGIHDELTVVAPGMNAKMNEIQAAFGLLQLKYIDSHLVKREKLASQYQSLLQTVSGIRLLDVPKDVTQNYSYFPIFIEESYKLSRDELYEFLKSNNVFSRRYFYPLISNFSTYSSLPSADKNLLKKANKLAEQVLCLPIYPDLSENDVNRICELIN